MQKSRLPASYFQSAHGWCVSANFAIAVIDDDDSFRVALVESLASFGYESRAYPSAEEYFRAAVDPSLSCIVTDIHMPGMSGLDLTKRLADQGSTMPVILITARSDASLETRAAAAGATCLLRKPFEMNHLIKCIEEAVKGSAVYP